MRLRNPDGTYAESEDIPHGTPSGYGWWRCRCSQCKYAHAIAQQRLRNKRRGLPLPSYDPDVVRPIRQSQQKPRKPKRRKTRTPIPEAQPITLTPEHRWTRERGWHIPV